MPGCLDQACPPVQTGPHRSLRLHSNRQAFGHDQSSLPRLPFPVTVFRMENLQLCNETALGFGAAEDSSVGAVKIGDVRLESLAKNIVFDGRCVGDCSCKM